MSRDLISRLICSHKIGEGIHLKTSIKIHKNMHQTQTKTYKKKKITARRVQVCVATISHFTNADLIHMNTIPTYIIGETSATNVIGLKNS